MYFVADRHKSQTFQNIHIELEKKGQLVVFGDNCFIFSTFDVSSDAQASGC